jgi:hypothetical protein
MKKLITILIALVLVSSMVFAQGNAPEDAGKPEKVDSAPEDAGKPENVGKPEDVGKPELISAGTDSPKGLAMALTKVKNENARQKLQQNLDKFQEKYQQRLQKMEDVEVEEVDEETGATKVKAKEPVKYFGFIKGKATKRFNINAEGKIEEKAPWYGFLYAEDNSE